MQIHTNPEKQQFHLTNGQISYIFHVMKNGQLGHLYYGKARVTERISLICKPMMFQLPRVVIHMRTNLPLI